MCFSSEAGWGAGVPVSVLLILMGNVQQATFLEIRGEQLHADRQAIDKTCRHGQARQTGEVGGDGVNVFQVRGDRVVVLGAELPGRVRRGWAEDDVDLIEGGHEVVLDQATDLLRLEVVGVVVTGRQCIGTDHDPALYFRAETFATGTLVQVFQVFRVFAAIAETYAIEARQVGGRFRRGDHVVRRNRVLHVRQADFLDHGAELFQLFNAGHDQVGDARVQACAEVFLRHADAQALQRTVEAGAVIRHGLVDAGGVLRVETGHALQQDRAVFGGTGQRAALIEAGCVGDHAPARNTTVRRFQAG